jgi:hypothetical protein
MPQLVRGYTHAAAPAVGAQPAAAIAKAQRPVAIEEDVVAGRLPAYLQIGAQSSHNLRAEIDDAILEPFGLFNAHTPAFEVEVSQLQAAHLADAQMASQQYGARSAAALTSERPGSIIIELG